VNLNKVIFSGRLCADPQLKYLPSQTPVVELRLATNKRWKTQAGEDREKAIFVDAKAFGKTAESINSFFQKGKEICVEAGIDYEEWEDKNGGGKRSKVSLLIDRFHFVGPKEEQSHPPEEDQTRGYPRTRQTVKAGAPQEPPFSEEQQFKDDDIPF
jgi:single-strand DNA-binding protein